MRCSNGEQILKTKTQNIQNGVLIHENILQNWTLESFSQGVVFLSNYRHKYSSTDSSPPWILSPVTKFKNKLKKELKNNTYLQQNENEMK